MKKNLNFFKITLIIAAIGMGSSYINAQCANTSNIYSFNYSGETYQVVKENKSWANASACAVQKGGYLAEINNQNEQDAVFSAIQSAGINLNSTTAADGGGSSYLWLGGNDMATEGKWIWDGNNDGIGAQFWQGDFNGSVVGGLYNNWGMEPDDYLGNQDALAIGLTDWPYGIAGQWNDLAANDLLYYVIEYNLLLGVNDAKTETPSKVYPNPVNDILNVTSKKIISQVIISDVSGREIRVILGSNQLSKKIDFSKLNNGIYFLKVIYKDKSSTQHKVVKSISTGK